MLNKVNKGMKDIKDYVKLTRWNIQCLRRKSTLNEIKGVLYISEGNIGVFGDSNRNYAKGDMERKINLKNEKSISELWYSFK